LIVPAAADADLEAIFDQIEDIRKNAMPHRGISAKEMIEEGRR